MRFHCQFSFFLFVLCNMTTTGPVETSFLPYLFNIQYPNTVMYSLREPFKDMSTVQILPDPQQVSPSNVMPTDLDTEETNKRKTSERVQTRQKSKRSAGVQCSILLPEVHQNKSIQTKIDRRAKPVNYVYEDEMYDDIEYNPRPHRLRKPMPAEYQQKVYEIWDVESSPPMHRRKPRRPRVEYPYNDEFESDYDDERFQYARQPRRPVRKTYLPPNVQMLCVRDEVKRISH